MLPFPDRTKEWIAGGELLRWTPYGGARRWEALLGVALAQAWRQSTASPATPPSGPAALIIGRPEPMRPGKSPLKLDAPPPEWLALEALPPIVHVEHVEAGACNVHAALHTALRLFDTTPVRVCLIGVADSQLDIRTMRWHEDHYRLKCSYLTDGLMPAEAACFLIVESQEAAEARGARSIARILSVSGRREIASLLSDQPNGASALTEAVREALEDAAIEAKAVGMIWSDLNGESYRAREWAYTEIRTGFQTHTELMHPADCHGDLGAATDANLFGLAALCHGTGWSEGKPLLVFAGSEGGLRAASVLAAGDQEFLQVSRDVPRVLSSTFQLPEPPDGGYKDSRDPLRAYFELRLREDHRDDLAALYYQRRGILHGSLPWTQLKQPEQRILNHVDALVASGPASMAATACALRSGEEGACFAGALVVAVLPSHENLQWIAKAVERAAPESIAGIEAALLHAPDNASLDQLIADCCWHDDPAICAMGVRVAGLRRINLGDRIRDLLGSPHAAVLRAAASACWRLDVADCATPLVRLLSHDSLEVRRASLGSLLVLLRGRTADFCRSRMRENERFGGDLARCLGMAGNTADVEVLLARLHEAPWDVSCIEGLGVLGVPTCCPSLIQATNSPVEELKLAAASALDLISGLGAFERVAAARDPDDPPTEMPRQIERVNTSPEFWSRWWHDESNRARGDHRWRRGEFHTLGTCIAELADPRSNLRTRDRAALELAAHADVAIPYEPCWFAAKQQLAVRAWQLWWQSRAVQ